MQTNKDAEYPPEFNIFVDKQILFKVEVSEGNVKKKYRNYTVKRATDDVSIIEQFMSKHNLKVLYRLIVFGLPNWFLVNVYINV